MTAVLVWAGLIGFHVLICLLAEALAVTDRWLSKRKYKG